MTTQTTQSRNPQRYEELNGLRTISAIGILLMHVLRNSSLDISHTDLSYRIITALTNFVFLFMIISAFGLCCGYYDKILDKTFSVVSFYSKRFSRILPFFALLVFLDFISSPSISSFVEAIADISLVFGFLPNPDMSVIGVGWFIGTIFVFYIAFPFICYIMMSKWRLFIAMVTAIFYNIAIEHYFLQRDSILLTAGNRSNFLYSSSFFLAGCIIYLSKDFFIPLVRKHEILSLFFVILITILAFIFLALSSHKTTNNMVCLLYFSVLTIYAISVKNSFLNNRFTAFISDCSFDIYLSHMLFFRIVSKLNLSKYLGNSWLLYIVTSLIVFILAVSFSYCYSKAILFAKNILTRKK